MAFSARDYLQWVRLGEGGEAEVFRARQVSLDRFVAIKRLKLDRNGAGDMRRFERAARLSASMHHPGIVEVYDYGEENGFYYLVMEYIPGLELHRVTGLDSGAKLDLALQMVELLMHVHSCGVLHRDLKPENFMVTMEGRVKLLDLGLARAGYHTVTRDQANLRGTLPYFPPEIFQGQREWTPQSEYYSLALVILELFIEDRIFDSGPLAEVVGGIQAGIPWEKLSLSGELRRALTPYLSLSPAHRPLSLEQLGQALESMLKAMPRRTRAWGQLAEHIRRLQSAWLREQVQEHESASRLEEAFVLAKEMLETDPGDEQASVWLQRIGAKLNQPTASHAVPRRRARPALVWGVGTTLLGGVVLVGTLLLPRSGKGNIDLGSQLAIKEKRLLALETRPVERSVSGIGRAYGVLYFQGLPDSARLMLNGKAFPARERLQLPMDNYWLEIHDAQGKLMLGDSVDLRSAEPVRVDLTFKKAR